MIKFDKNEFLKPQIYSTLDEYETRCNVTEEIIKEIEQLQQENKILKENAENNDKVVDKVNWENQLLKKENQQIKDNWNKLKEIIKKKFVAQGGFTSYEWNDLLNELLDKMQELEQGRDE